MRYPALTLLTLSLFVILSSPSLKAANPSDSDDQAQMVQLDHLYFEEHPCIEISKANMNSHYWQTMLNKLQVTARSDLFSFTVFRVLQEYPTKQAPITASSSMVKNFTSNGHISGGGLYCKVDSGDAILWQHDTRRYTTEKQQTIRIGHAASGIMEFHTTQPPAKGKPQCYEIYLKVCPKYMRGKLIMTLNKPRHVSCTSFTLNMVANGGIYGIDYRWPYNNNRAIELAPGPYKFLFRQINQRDGRFDFVIKPGVTTKLSFEAQSQNSIKLVGQSFSPRHGAQRFQSKRFRKYTPHVTKPSVATQPKPEEQTPGSSQSTDSTAPAQPDAKGESSPADKPDQVTNQTQPDGKKPVFVQHHEPPAPTVIPDYDGPLIEVAKADIESEDWQKALSMLANQKYAQRTQYSIARVTKAQGLDDLPVLFCAHKLKKLSAEYDGGGGMYFKGQDGDFFIWEHMRGANSQPGSPATIIIGHPQAGGMEFQTTVPKAGVINVMGDVVVHPCPEKRMGNVHIQIEKSDDIKATGFYIGTINAGGNLSTRYPLNADGQSKLIDLPPGQYKILFGNFNRKTGLTKFTVEEGKTTELKYKAISQDELQKM
ncbi:MAG: hypothetical protein ACF8OB_06110 [Phycisphaeraceae bacterium JB051]